LIQATEFFDQPLVEMMATLPANRVIASCPFCSGEGGIDDNSADHYTNTLQRVNGVIEMNLTKNLSLL